MGGLNVLAAFMRSTCAVAGADVGDAAAGAAGWPCGRLTIGVFARLPTVRPRLTSLASTASAGSGELGREKNRPRELGLLTLGPSDMAGDAARNPRLGGRRSRPVSDRMRGISGMSAASDTGDGGAVAWRLSIDTCPNCDDGAVAVEAVRDGSVDVI